MKKYRIILLSSIAGMLMACSGGKPSEGVPVVFEKEPCLEDVLNIQSEDSLVKAYGKENVTYDTIWGAEGFFTMGTMLHPDEKTRVEIMWMDSANRTGMISATLVSSSDYYSEKLDGGKWKSCTGVAIGMSLEEVQKINGRPFTFSGFGWDYGGGIISWEDGTLEGKGLTLQLSEGAGSVDFSDEESKQVLGDVPVSSDNKVAAKLKPRVWSISVAKVQ